MEDTIIVIVLLIIFVYISSRTQSQCSNILVIAFVVFIVYSLVKYLRSVEGSVEGYRVPPKTVEQLYNDLPPAPSSTFGTSGPDYMTNKTEWTDHNNVLFELSPWQTTCRAPPNEQCGQCCVGALRGKKATGLGQFEYSSDTARMNNCTSCKCESY